MKKVLLFERARLYKHCRDLQRRSREQPQPVNHFNVCIRTKLLQYPLQVGCSFSFSIYTNNNCCIKTVVKHWNCNHLNQIQPPFHSTYQAQFCYFLQTWRDFLTHLIYDAFEEKLAICHSWWVFETKFVKSCLQKHDVSTWVWPSF